MPKEEVITPALEKGKEVHAALDEAFKTYQHTGEAAQPQVKDEYKPLVEHFDIAQFITPEDLKHAASELKLALTDHLTETDFEDPNAAFRGIIDLVIVRKDHIMFIEYKTGRKAPYHKEQLDFYAFLFSHARPFLAERRLEGQIIYFTPKGIKVTVYHPNANPDKWLAIRQEILQRTEWPAKKSYACKWCPVKAKCQPLSRA